MLALLLGIIIRTDNGTDCPVLKHILDGIVIIRRNAWPSQMLGS